MAITKNSQIDLNGNEMILDADGDTTITADTDDQINIKVGGTDAFNLLGSKFIIGDTASHVDDLLQIETPASGGGHGIQIRRNDSNTDQGIGRILFGNNTDTDLATISAKTDGANDSGALTFSTQATGGSTSESMRIDSSGNLCIGATSSSTKVTIQAADTDTVNSSANGHLTFFDDAPFGYYKIRIATTNRDLAFDGYDTDNAWKEILKLDRVDQRINSKGGIMFGSDTAAANTLDDYEEGTWQADHGGNNMTGNGYYVKVGSLVHFQGDWTSASGSSTSHVINGLPFNSSTSRGHSSFTVGFTDSGGGHETGYTQSNFIALIQNGNQACNLAAGQRVLVQGTYSTND